VSPLTILRIIKYYVRKSLSEEEAEVIKAFFGTAKFNVEMQISHIAYLLAAHYASEFVKNDDDCNEKEIKKPSSS